MGGDHVQVAGGGAGNNFETTEQLGKVYIEFNKILITVRSAMRSHAQHAEASLHCVVGWCVCLHRTKVLNPPPTSRSIIAYHLLHHHKPVCLLPFFSLFLLQYISNLLIGPMKTIAGEETMMLYNFHILIHVLTTVQVGCFSLLLPYPLLNVLCFLSIFQSCF